MKAETSVQSKRPGQSERPGQSGETAETTVETVNVEAVNSRENRSLFKSREKIQPKRASGDFRRLKWIIMGLTLAFYYGAPWLRWDRGASAPDQAILIDLPAGRFYFFFIEIWPQEVYYLTGLLIIAAMMLFLMTSLAGRVWCGYSCPQTVWTDLFLVIERFAEGDRAARIRLDKAPMSVSKFKKRLIKHTLWIITGILTGGAWVFYFADAPTLLVNLVTLNAPSIAYITIAVLASATYLFGGHAREQVCTYMCPWPRIQAAMVDEHSLMVTYRARRGEPRADYAKDANWDQRGHCIDCNNCVVVCPMGIDIRDGEQLECINCALCIDACDDVMKRIDLPTGLIGYDTPANEAMRAQGLVPRLRLIRPRTLIYAAFIIFVAAVMLVTLLTRSDVGMNVLRDRNPLYVTLSDGSIRNRYTVKILNKFRDVRQFTVTVDGMPTAILSLTGGAIGESIAALTVRSDRLRSFRILVTTPASAINGAATAITLQLRNSDGEVVRESETTFRAPSPKRVER
ncbi:MAG: cytochrome c oxidase accessory protein CcoG [Alphaproteobacteria bacterium]|nr:cytochrome c oxidase accessory protein CcoG [Alphaproteobacteria bacterium]